MFGRLFFSLNNSLVAVESCLQIVVVDFKFLDKSFELSDFVGVYVVNFRRLLQGGDLLAVTSLELRQTLAVRILQRHQLHLVTVARASQLRLQMLQNTQM